MNSENSRLPIRHPISVIALSLGLFSCAESLPEKKQSDAPNSTLNNRAITQNEQIKEVFGSGFTTNNDGLGIPAFGFVGNTGGFGFSGSIASIIGNMGGFGGFGGFGAFASFLAGSLPTSPPTGFIPPPGTGVAPIAGIPPVNGNFGPPPGTIFGPAPGSIPGFGGGFTPPVGFTPPPTGFVPPFNPPPALGTTPAQVSNAQSRFTPSTNQINLLDINLAETNSGLTANDLDFIFVAPASNNSFNLLAITETVTPCAGGGTRTLVVDDVDPVGLSAGDSRTTTFADCIRGAAGGPTINGSRGFRTDSMIGAPFLDPVWSSQNSMFETNLTRTSANYTSTSNGTTTSTISVDEIGVIQTASGSGDLARTDLTTNAGYTHNYTFNIDFVWNNATQDFSINFSINIDSVATQNAQISVDTTTPLTGLAGAAPTAGQVTITVGTNNVASHIETLTAQADGTVLIESDTNGDGVPDATRTAAIWSDVLFELFNAPI